MVHLAQPGQIQCPVNQIEITLQIQEEMVKIIQEVFILWSPELSNSNKLPLLCTPSCLKKVLEERVLDLVLLVDEILQKEIWVYLSKPYFPMDKRRSRDRKRRRRNF